MALGGSRGERAPPWWRRRRRRIEHVRVRVRGSIQVGVGVNHAAFGRPRAEGARHRRGAGARAGGARPLVLLAARHRGLSQSGGADDRSDHPARRHERRRGGALRHRSAGERAGGHDRSRSHPLAVALRPLRREVLLHLEADLCAGAAAGDQSIAVHLAAGGIAAPALSLECHRRDLSIYPPWPRLFAARAEDGAGLDPREAVQAGPRRHRRGRLRRRDRAISRRRRSLSIEGP